jgi:hypothetical protein
MATSASTGRAAEWTLCRWTDAAQLVAVAGTNPVPDEASGMAPAEWFARLREQGRPVDAVNFLAQALPRYECVVWASRTLLESGAIERTDPLALAALRWTDEPSDELRRAAGDAAEAASERDDSPAVLLCRAVFLSGGSLAPVDLPAIQPRPELCGRLAAGAILLAAYNGANPRDVLEPAFAIGSDIVSGR